MIMFTILRECWQLVSSSSWCSCPGLGSSSPSQHRSESPGTETRYQPRSEIEIINSTKATSIIIYLISERVLHSRHLILSKHIALAMIGQLTPDRVEHCSHELSSETKISAELARKLFWIIILIRQVPLKLINLTRILFMFIVTIQVQVKVRVKSQKSKV